MGGTTIMLADIIANIKTKHIVITTGGVIGLIVLIMGLSGGLVVVSSPKEEVAGFWQRIDTDQKDKQPLTISKGGWSLQFLSSGQYSIELSSGSKTTQYRPSVGWFSFQSIQVALQPQALSQSLGFQNSDCLLHDKDFSQLAFYSCDKSVENRGYVALTQNGFDFNDNPSSQLVAPYMGGLLQIDNAYSDIDTRIQFDRYENNKVVYSKIIRDFPASFGDHFFVTDQQDKANSRFVYFDQTTETAYFFASLTRKPVKIDLKKQLDSKQGFVYRFLLDGDSLYVFNGLDDQANFGDGEVITPEQADGQTITLYSIETAAQKGQMKLPNNFIVERFTAYKDQVTIEAQEINTKTGGLYRMSQKDPSPELLLYGDVLDICYSGDTLYYLSDDFTIFQYDDTTKASGLKYQSQNHNPVNLNCLYGEISFPLQTTQDGSSDYTWARLTDQPLGNNQTRDEDIFPILNDSVSRISYAYLFKDTVRVVLDGNGLCGAVDSETKQATLVYLKDLGVASDRLQISITYDC